MRDQVEGTDRVSAWLKLGYHPTAGSPTAAAHHRKGRLGCIVNQDRIRVRCTRLSMCHKVLSTCRPHAPQARNDLKDLPPGARVVSIPTGLNEPARRDINSSTKTANQGWGLSKSNLS